MAIAAQSTQSANPAQSAQSAQAAQPQLKVSQLAFGYPKRWMFDDWHCSLGPGITWLRGQNGSGKTTLLKLLGGALDAKRGSIQLNGLDIKQDALAYRKRSFWCSSEVPDFSWLSVQEFLDLHLALYPRSQSALVQAELEALKMLPTLNSSINTLSLGQHKKLHLMLALALPVDLLLIDEPFNALDVEAAQYLRQRLSDPARLARQCIVLTSHIAPELPLAAQLQLDQT